jgi:hypothetical protein
MKARIRRVTVLEVLYFNCIDCGRPLDHSLFGKGLCPRCQMLIGFNDTAARFMLDYKDVNRMKWQEVKGNFNLTDRQIEYLKMKMEEIV